MESNYKFSSRNFGNLGGVPIEWDTIAKDRPTLTFEEIEIPPFGDFHGIVNNSNVPIKMAGKHSWDNLVLIFEEDEDNNLTKLIQHQLHRQEQALKNINGILKNKDYVFDFDIINEDEKWTIEGAFLKEIDWFGLDVIDKSKQGIKITICFNNAMVFQHENM